MGDMYEGFLMVDRLFFRETGHHIPFVTLYADPATRTIHAGEPIIFQGDLRDREERRRVTDLIRRQLSGEMQAQPAAEAAVQAPR